MGIREWISAAPLAERPSFQAVLQESRIEAFRPNAPMTLWTWLHGFRCSIMGSGEILNLRYITDEMDSIVFGGE